MTKFIDGCKKLWKSICHFFGSLPHKCDDSKKK